MFESVDEYHKVMLCKTEYIENLCSDPESNMINVLFAHCVGDKIYVFYYPYNSFESSNSLKLDDVNMLTIDNKKLSVQSHKPLSSYHIRNLKGETNH